MMRLMKQRMLAGAVLAVLCGPAAAQMIDPTKAAWNCRERLPQAEVAAMMLHGADPSKLGVCPDAPFPAETALLHLDRFSTLQLRKEISVTEAEYRASGYVEFTAGRKMRSGLELPGAYCGVELQPGLKPEHGMIRVDASRLRAVWSATPAWPHKIYGPDVVRYGVHVWLFADPEIRQIYCYDLGHKNRVYEVDNNQDFLEFTLAALNRHLGADDAVTYEPVDLAKLPQEGRDFITAVRRYNAELEKRGRSAMQREDDEAWKNRGKRMKETARLMEKYRGAMGNPDGR